MRKRATNACQRQLKGGDEQLYSATKQQTEGFKQRVRKQMDHDLKVREYPTILRHDCVRLQRQQKNEKYRWWIRLPA